MRDDRKVSGYLTRELKIELYQALAAEELKFTDWLRKQAKAWLAQHEQQQAPALAGNHDAQT